MNSIFLEKIYLYMYDRYAHNIIFIETIIFIVGYIKVLRQIAL